MPRTTPPRPADVEAAFPELVALRRSATRLHPRRGTPPAQDSSAGGPRLGPADEPWPVCTLPHRRGTGFRFADVLSKRESQEQARLRDPAGPTPEEAEFIDAVKSGPYAPQLADTDPIPMIGVAQLYSHDVPGLAGLPGSGDGDLLQVFWCGFELHGETGHEPHVQLRRRRSQGIGTPLAEQPAPAVVGREELVPSPCVLYPEAIVEHPYLESLDPSLQERIDDWEGPEEDEGPQYIFDLSTAPGWKTGGYIAWNLTGPTPLNCSDCGADLTPLLTVDRREWDPATISWIPYEDEELRGVRRANVPTRVSPGRGRLIIAVCPRDAHHPLGLVTQ
jgi:hypothetical protein